MRLSSASHRAARLSARAWLDRGAFSQGLREGVLLRGGWGGGFRFAQQPGGSSQVASSQEGSSRGGSRWLSLGVRSSSTNCCPAGPPRGGPAEGPRCAGGPGCAAGRRLHSASHRAAGLSARAWLDRGAFSQGLREGLSARAWLDREGLRFAQQPGGTSQVASSQEGGSRGGCR